MTILIEIMFNFLDHRATVGILSQRVQQTLGRGYDDQFIELFLRPDRHDVAASTHHRATLRSVLSQKVIQRHFKAPHHGKDMSIVYPVDCIGYRQSTYPGQQLLI